MKIRGGHTIEVFRSTTKDRHGDAVESPVGTIENVVVQWVSANPLDRFQENDSMSTVVFAPRDAEVRLQARDRFKLRGETYQVIGDRNWDEVHPSTGHDFGYYMMQVQVIG